MGRWALNLRRISPLERTAIKPTFERILFYGEVMCENKI